MVILIISIVKFIKIFLRNKILIKNYFCFINLFDLDIYLITGVAWLKYYKLIVKKQKIDRPRNPNSGDTLKHKKPNLN